MVCLYTVLSYTTLRDTTDGGVDAGNGRQASAVSGLDKVRSYKDTSVGLVAVMAGEPIVF